MANQNGNSPAVPFYEPPPDADNAELRLMRLVETKRGQRFGEWPFSYTSFPFSENYEEWYRFSVDQYPLFWEMVLRFCDIRIYSDYTQIVEDKPIDQIPRWFIGATTNYADNCLKNGKPDQVAFIQACKYLYFVYK
jgi:hypothetical protein